LKTIKHAAAAASLAVLGLSFTAPAAEASVIRLTATGVLEWDILPGGPEIPDRPELPFERHYGDQFTITMDIDLATPAFAPGIFPGQDGYPDAVLAARATIGSFEIDLPITLGTQTSSAWVYNDYQDMFSPSPYFLEAISLSASDAFSGTRNQLSLSASTFSTSPIPTLTSTALDPSQLTALRSPQMQYLFYGENNVSIGVGGTIQSLTVTPVPLPGGALLLLTGVGILVPFRLRAKTKSPQ
jgi:hypothetical protein